MSWKKGSQRYRMDFASIPLNEKLKQMDGSLKEEDARYYLYKFLRNNIPFTCELFLGVKLFPFQAMAIKGMMISDYSMFVFSRGMSKTYSMTGWRIGYAFGEEKIIKAMSKIQGQATSCANSISQSASVEALTGDQSAAEQMKNKFKERRNLMVSLLNEIPGSMRLEPMVKSAPSVSTRIFVS